MTLNYIDRRGVYFDIRGRYFDMSLDYFDTRGHYFDRSSLNKEGLMEMGKGEKVMDL